MKRVCYIVLMLCLMFSSCSKTKYLQKHSTKAHIEFKEGEHNFGQVIFGHPAEWNFEFVNTGADTLRITEVQSTCGCTVPQWPKDKIAPNEKGAIKVVYDSQRSGIFQKAVTVFSNADNSALVLVVTGEVTPNPHKIIIGGKSATQTSGTDTIQYKSKMDFEVGPDVQIMEE